ncbi:tetratricopeptide repeat protein [Paralcaligenes ginsengisoli]
MFRNLASPLVVIALLTGSLSCRAAIAQTTATGLQPHVDLSASLSSTGLGDAQGISPQSTSMVVPVGTPAHQKNGAKLFTEPPKKDGGWQGLANVLEALTPSVDTEIPLTASQITDRISAMLNQGQNQQALDVIEKRIAQEQSGYMLGTDVQLLFLHARALAALGRSNEAITIYQNMTTLYPELPEPWNNLAALYIKQGKLEMARDALQMALTANPNYPTAKANMGQVQLMLARQSFEQAAQLGVSNARSKAVETQSILENSPNQKKPSENKAD